MYQYQSHLHIIFPYLIFSPSCFCFASCLVFITLTKKIITITIHNMHHWYLVLFGMIVILLLLYSSIIYYYTLYTILLLLLVLVLFVLPSVIRNTSSY
jgi:hypothetical protein